MGGAIGCRQRGPATCESRRPLAVAGYRVLCVQTRPAAFATVHAGCLSLGRTGLAAEQGAEPGVLQSPVLVTQHQQLHF